MAKIAKEIGIDEPCARCIVHPYGYSDSHRRVQGDAFVPAKGDGNVSLLRMRYASHDFCRSHGLAIGGDGFRGLAVISQGDVDSSYELWCEAYPDNVDGFMKPVIVSSPIGEDGEYRDIAEDVYDTDKGLPMHADMHYPSESGHAAKETKSMCRSFSKLLVKGLRHDAAEDVWRL